MSCRFAVKSWFAFVITYGVMTSHLSAQIPTNAEITDDIINGLRIAERANVSLGEIPDQNSVSFEAFATGVILAEERTIRRLQDAATRTTISAVDVSENVGDVPDIVGIAKEFGENYLALVDNLRKMQSYYRALMDPRNLNPTSMSSLIAEGTALAVDLERGWEMLPELTTKLTWALVDTPAEEGELPNTLLMSESKKNSMISMLENYDFGDDIRTDSAEGSQVRAAAKVLWMFLNMPWETTDPY